MIGEDLLACIFSRLEKDELAIFGRDEYKYWPDNALDILKQLNMLVRSQPATVIECEGCEENCIMPISSCSAKDNSKVHFFVACDKRDDVGLIPINTHQLETWQISRQLLAEALALLMGLRRRQCQMISSWSWMLGSIERSKNKTQVILLFKEDVFLKIGDHSTGSPH